MTVATAPTMIGRSDEASRLSRSPLVRQYATLTFLRGALVSLAIALCAGMIGVLFYIPNIAPLLTERQIDFTALRPIHTAFISAWIFLGGVAIVHRYMQDHAGRITRGECFRLLLQVLLWGAAGGGILATLMLGIYSGREYIGFHPIFSAMILLGWFLFAWNFFRATWRGFWDRPVYVTMWGVGVLFFMYTFIEQHVWLLPDVFSSPIVDLRIQWKATGTLIGSFNLFVYGTLYYIAEKISGNERYARSKLAYALLGVGLLNSFTNFGHHTYHLPQSEVVKWISFVVSMAEVIILTRIVWDIALAVSKRHEQSFNAVRYFLGSAKWWTFAMFFSAILISIPPLNSFIHGTHVVTGHAMGTEIGIDSMVLFAGLSFILCELLVRRGGNDAIIHCRSVRLAAIGLNLFAALLVLWLHVSGSVIGYTRYEHLPPPVWYQQIGPYLFAGTGFAMALVLGFLLAAWLHVAFRRVAEPSTQTATFPDLEQEATGITD